MDCLYVKTGFGLVEMVETVGAHSAPANPESIPLFCKSVMHGSNDGRGVRFTPVCGFNRLAAINQRL